MQEKNLARKTLVFQPPIQIEGLLIYSFQPAGSKPKSTDPLASQGATKVNIVGRPVLMWVLDYLSITKEDSIFLAVPAPILKQYDIKKMLARMLPQVGVSRDFSRCFMGGKKVM